MSPKEYARAIERVLQSGIATEHSHRPALKAFIESLAPGVCVINEPKSVACGAPDLIVQQGSVPLGYIEAKDIGKSLDHEEKSEQLKRYREGLRNLILTDYLDFRWYVRGELRLTARLAKADSKGKLRPVHNGYFEVLALLNEFLRGRASAVADPRELAKRLAGLARLIRESILKTFGHEAKNGTLHALFEGFRRVLIADLTGEQFADMYAQTICYGLFAARCRHEGPAAFTRESAAYDLPRTNPFLREVFSQIAGPGLDEQLVWVVDDLVSLLDRADMASILKDFGKRTRQEDPVLHFYETFLGEYDAALREKRGVYYTPEPVVSYIVRSVDEILKRQFALRDGLADCSTVDVLVTGANPDGKTTRPHKVIVLDPAVGTGTFLRTVIDHIHEHVLAKGMGGAWSSYVSQHLLPRLFGFELLMAPYAVCHMKLAIELEETGYDFTSNERLHVYLTNSLEEAHERPDPQLFAQVLAREAREASDIKQSKPVMVVLGNPPYSGHSANKGDWIKNLLRQRLPQGASGYFEVDGKPLGERNPKWLNDDYVKFIRFAQWRIEQSGYGILAFVSNHGYLDNPTFRGMRRSLLETFDEIYVLDLHGNSKKREHAPDGSKDENVFDIQQGVAIGIFVKRETRRTAPAHVFHAELWGPREVCKQGAPSRDPRISGK